jgi:uncharacterized membrane protein YeaQ/YmgE (transglycosylase-associated protein family)
MDGLLALLLVSAANPAGIIGFVVGVATPRWGARIVGAIVAGLVSTLFQTPEMALLSGGFALFWSWVGGMIQAWRLRHHPLD